MGDDVCPSGTSQSGPAPRTGNTCVVCFCPALHLWDWREVERETQTQETCVNLTAGTWKSWRRKYEDGDKSSQWSLANKAGWGQQTPENKRKLVKFVSEKRKHRESQMWNKRESIWKPDFPYKKNYPKPFGVDSPLLIFINPYKDPKNVSETQVSSCLRMCESRRFEEKWSSRRNRGI